MCRNQFIILNFWFVSEKELSYRTVFEIWCAIIMFFFFGIQVLILLVLSTNTLLPVFVVVVEWNVVIGGDCQHTSVVC